MPGTGMGKNCAREGCTRPPETGSDTCSQCNRLTGRTSQKPPADSVAECKDILKRTTAGGEQLRCRAWLNTAGNVITFELTAGPKFTEEDVGAAILALQKARKSK